MGNVLLVGLTGSCPKHIPRRTFVAKSSGLTRGDRRRNGRIEGLRAVVGLDRAVLAVDLGEDKQVAVLMDHEGRVLGRRSLKVKAHGLGGLLTWAAGQAARRGFAGVVVGCEPTGHRWRAVMQFGEPRVFRTADC
jgi:transposase